MQRTDAPGCGTVLPQIDGPTHAYMLSSPACWSDFNAILATEYSDPGIGAAHCLTVAGDPSG